MTSSSPRGRALAATALLAGLAALALPGHARDTTAARLDSWSLQIAQSNAVKSDAAKPSAAKAAETRKTTETAKPPPSARPATPAKADAKDGAAKAAAAKEGPGKTEPQARPAADKGEPAGQLQPQAHASNGGVTACFDSLARASSHVIDGEHQAFSFWDRARPDTGTFRSIIALRYGSNVSPRGAAVIVNSPMQTSECDATTLQVMPTARPCSAIQNSLIEKGTAVANLTGLALIQTKNDTSYLLLPTAGDGCAIVSLTVIRRN